MTRALLAGLILVLCAWSGGAAAMTSPPDLAGTSWVAEEIAGLDVQVTPSTLTFETGMRITGWAGCNYYTGSAKLSGTSIAVGAMSSTLMACEDQEFEQEKSFHKAMRSARTFTFHGGVLTLHDADGNDLIRFRRK